MRRVETLLQELGIELTNAPAEPSNEAAIERALETCITEVRRLNASERVSLSRDTLDDFTQEVRRDVPPCMERNGSDSTVAVSKLFV